MTFLIVVLAVLAVLFLIGCIPLGASVEYSSDGLNLSAIAGPVRIRLLPKQEKTGPGKEKKEKKKKKGRKPKKAGRKEKPSGEGEKKAEKKGGSLEKVLNVLPTAFQTLGRFFRKLRIRKLIVRYALCGEDPSDLAFQYGAVSGGLGILGPTLVRFFRIRDYDVTVTPDFRSEESTVYVNAEAVILIRQLIWLVLKLDFKAVFSLIK